MTTDTFILEGRAYSWRKLCELRRAQLAAIRAARGTQSTLFPLQEDCRPKSERTAAQRYAEPSLLAWREEDA